MLFVTSNYLALFSLPNQKFYSFNSKNSSNENNSKLDISAVMGLTKGVSLSPIDYSGNFSAFFDKAQEAGSILTWGGDFDAFKNDTGSAYAVTNLFLAKGFTPVIIIHPDEPDKVNETQKLYAKHYAEMYHPKFLGIGNEINGEQVYEQSAEKFDNFTKLFNETYDIIKSVSPLTKIFTIFQLERMKGLQGGLFGGTNDTTNLNDWFLMNNASKADFFAFTTYPCMIYGDPSEMPSDYYTEILAHTNKPIAFTEIGWYYGVPTGSGWEPWNSSKQEQADFVGTYFSLTKTIPLEFNIWAFLYDQAAPVPFDKMGLLAKTENSSLAWREWINYFRAFTDAGEPELDGDFKIYWTNSSEADNYTLYWSTHEITKENINASNNVFLLYNGTGLEYNIQGWNEGTYYFMVCAFSIAGNYTTDNLLIQVEFEEEGDDDDDDNETEPPAISGYNLLMLCVISSLIFFNIFKKLKKPQKVII